MIGEKIKKRDEELANVEAALLRAAKKAKEIAERTHTPLVIYENGHLVKKNFNPRKK